MATFAYRAADGRGEVRAGLLQGADAGAVKAALQRDGLYPLELEERGASARSSGDTRSLLDRLRPAAGEVPGFTRSLASFLAAGFPLDRALSMCVELAGHPRLAAALRQVRREIQQGRSLAGALETRPDLFDPLYVNTVGAAERAGALEAGLANLAAHLEERRELRRQIQATLVYPSLMAVVGGLAVVVLLLIVIPRFVTILEGSGQNLPWATALLLGVSRFLSRFGWALLLLAAVAFAGIRAWLSSAGGRLEWDRRKLRLPLVGGFTRKLVAARFSRALGTLLQNGVPLPAALRLSAETVGNAAATRAVREAQSRVKEGESVATALGRSDVLPIAALRMTAVGEETGKLEEMLLRAAELYEGEVRRDLRTAVGLVEPAMILVLGGLVAFVALAMIQAIFSVNDVPV